MYLRIVEKGRAVPGQSKAHIHGERSRVRRFLPPFPDFSYTEYLCTEHAGIIGAYSVLVQLFGNVDKCM